MYVRLTLASIRVVVERLNAGEVDFHTDSCPALLLPHRDDTCLMLRRERSVTTYSSLGIPLGRTDEGVRCRHVKGLWLPPKQKLGAQRSRWMVEIHQLHPIAVALQGPHADGISNQRSERGDVDFDRSQSAAHID